METPSVPQRLVVFCVMREDGTILMMCQSHRKANKMSGKKNQIFLEFYFIFEMGKMIFVSTIVLLILWMIEIDGALVAWHQQPGQLGRVALMGGPVVQLV